MLKQTAQVKGFQVAPAELEDVIRKIGGVKDVAVIGVDDEKSGEVPRAYVVKEVAEVTAEVIEREVKKQLADHKHLAGGVEFVNEIPKTASGKILRRELRTSYARRSGVSVLDSAASKPATKTMKLSSGRVGTLDY